MAREDPLTLTPYEFAVLYDDETTTEYERKKGTKRKEDSIRIRNTPSTIAIT